LEERGEELSNIRRVGPNRVGEALLRKKAAGTKRGGTGPEDRKDRILKVIRGGHDPVLGPPPSCHPHLFRTIRVGERKEKNYLLASADALYRNIDGESERPEKEWKGKKEGVSGEIGIPSSQ